MSKKLFIVLLICLVSDIISSISYAGNNITNPIDAIKSMRHLNDLRVIPSEMVVLIKSMGNEGLSDGRKICHGGVLIEIPENEKFTTVNRSNTKWIKIGEKVPYGIIVIWPNHYGYYDLVSEMDKEGIKFHKSMYPRWFDSKYEFLKNASKRTPREIVSKSNEIDNFTLLFDLEEKSKMIRHHPISNISFMKFSDFNAISFGDIKKKEWISLNLLTKENDHHIVTFAGINEDAYSKLLASIKSCR